MTANIKHLFFTLELHYKVLLYRLKIPINISFYKINLYSLNKYIFYRYKKR